jgi:hypothetical protein
MGISSVARAIASQTAAIRLVEQKTLALVRMGDRLEALEAFLRDSSSHDAEVKALVQTVVELSRDTRSDVRDALKLLYATQDRLQNQREKLGEMEERWTPARGIPIYVPPAPPVEPEEIPDGISKRGLHLNWDTFLVWGWKVAKVLGPLVAASGVTALYYALRQRFLGH